MGTVLVIVGLALALLAARYLMPDSVTLSGRTLASVHARGELPAPPPAASCSGYVRVNA
jgi:hypothetical protein